jgi:hypothetical protein
VCSLARLHFARLVDSQIILVPQRDRWLLEVHQVEIPSFEGRLHAELGTPMSKDMSRQPVVGVNVSAMFPEPERVRGVPPFPIAWELRR